MFRLPVYAYETKARQLNYTLSTLFTSGSKPGSWETLWCPSHRDHHCEDWVPNSEHTVHSQGPECSWFAHRPLMIDRLLSPVLITAAQPRVTSLLQQPLLVSWERYLLLFVSS